MFSKPKLLIAIIVTLSAYNTVKANENNDLRDALNTYNINEYDSAVDSIAGEIEDVYNLRYSDIVYNALTGDLNLITAVNQILKTAFKEVISSISLLRGVVIIAILGALLKSLNAGLGENGVSQIGFYAVYTALVSVLITSFVSSAQIASGAISTMTSLMQALIPLIMALLVASGRYSISFVFNPAAMLVTEIAAFFINTVLLKVIIFAAILQIINFLMPAGAFDNMTRLVYAIISGGLKWLSVLFMGFIAIETAAAPLAGSVIGKSAKVLVTSVPVVGSAFAGAVDSVFFWGHAVKNAAAIASIVAVLFVCAIPVVKLLALALIYMAAAAVIEPFADERAVSLLDAAGKYTMLFAGTVMCVCVMLITLLMMVIAGAIG